MSFTKTVNFKFIEAEFDRWLQTIKAQAWQDGHDTALINGQSQNPYEQEPR